VAYKGRGKRRARRMHNVVTIGWNDLSNLSSIKSREELKKLYEKV
jgi:hypothetical protein